MIVSVMCPAGIVRLNPEALFHGYVSRLVPFTTNVVEGLKAVIKLHGLERQLRAGSRLGRKGRVYYLIHFILP
jgi:hypothetical protein